MLPLLLLPLAAAAEPEAPPASPEPAPLPAAPADAPRDWDALLDVARDLAKAKDTETARGLLEWILLQDAPAPVHARARRALDALPPSREEWQPLLRVTAWQTTAGAFVLGPNLSWLSDGDLPGGVILVGSVAGGLAGGGTALWYGKSHGFTPADADAVVGAQQLGVFHGIALGFFSENEDVTVPVGIVGGLAAGAGAGYLLAGRGLDDGAMAAAHAGMFWGASGGALVMASLYAFDGNTGPELLALALASDAGAAGGYLLGSAIDITPQQVRMANLGGVAGAATLFGFVLVTSNRVPWVPGAVASTVAAGGLAGGVAGILLARDLDSPRVPALAMGTLVGGVDEHVVLGIPLPTVAPLGDGVAVTASLVDYRF